MVPTCRWEFNLSIGRPKADQTSPRTIARRVRILLKSLVGLAGARGTVRSLGPSISLATPWSPLDGLADGKELGRYDCVKGGAISRHIFVDNSDIIIDHATARRQDEPISTAATESTVQWLSH
jgi:hypothetical protein